jgi:3'(2'), 5'-bisphosphate nucleotidase
VETGTNESPEALVEACVELAELAGQAILEIYQQDFEVLEKQDRSPLTAADLASHRLLSRGLGELAPRIPLLSEESAEVPWNVRQGWSRYWLIDPLDGTREFVKKNGEFTVNIALVEGGEPVLGVVHAPAQQRMWFATRGRGAYARDAGQDRRLSVRAPAVAPLRVAASRSHLDERTAGLLAKLDGAQTRGLGSSLKFCHIAEGEIDLYPRFGPTSEWDTAAAQCVLECAGGAVLHLDGSPLSYNRKESLLNPYFLAIGDTSLPWRNWVSGSD